MHIPKISLGGGERRQRGQSLVEMAFVLPLFLVIVLAIVDFGLGIKSWISVTNSAREAARYGAVYCATGDANESDVIQRAIDTAPTLGLVAADVTVTNCTGGSSTESLVVDIDYQYDMITPLAGMLSFLGGGIPDSVTLSASADMRIE